MLPPVPSHFYDDQGIPEPDETARDRDEDSELPTPPPLPKFDTALPAASAEPATSAEIEDLTNLIAEMDQLQVDLDVAINLEDA